MKHKIITSLLLLFLFISCQSDQRAEMEERIMSQEAKHLESYSYDLSSPFLDRVYDAPDFLLTYLKNMDGVDNYTPYSLSSVEQLMLEQYFQLLPELNRRIMEEKIIGIYFVQNFIGTAMADYIFDEEGNLYNIFIINPDCMNYSISDWLTYRENSCFSGNDVELNIYCGDEYTGLLYAMLHESAHFVDYTEYFSPYAEYTSFVLEDREVDTENPFFQLWENYNDPREQYFGDYINKITYYGLGGGPQIESLKIPTLLEYLDESPFISLYSSMSWAEDFAELFSWLYYTEYLKQPYEIEVIEQGLPARYYRPAENPRVQERFAIVEKLISP